MTKILDIVIVLIVISFTIVGLTLMARYDENHLDEKEIICKEMCESRGGEYREKMDIEMCILNDIQYKFSKAKEECYLK